MPVTPTTPRKTYSSSIISPPKTDPKQVANIESKTIEALQVIEKYDLENLLKNLDKNQREVNKRLENLEKKLSESVKDNNKETVKDVSSLIAKLDSIESMISSVPGSSSTKNDSSYKDNQIDLLISEISSKNKEIERLKKSNSTLLQKQRDMEKLSNYENDLNNCISILEEKKAEIKELQLVRKELEAENKRLRERLEENFELEKELSVLRQELEISKHMSSTLDNELLIAKRTLETLEIDFDRHSAIIQDKNTIIHNFLLTKDQKNQSFTSDSNLTTGSEDPEEKNQSSMRKKILLIGDSLIKHIIPEHLLPQRFNFEVLVEKAYHIEEIPNVINSFDNFTDISTLVIHCGTHDIQSVPVDVLINKLKNVISLALELNPDIKIIVSNLTPRGDDLMLDLTRQEFNIKILKEFNDNSAVMISDNTRLSTDGFITDKFYGQDKIHLNADGTKILAANLGSSLRKINGFPQKQYNKQYNNGKHRPPRGR